MKQNVEIEKIEKQKFEKSLKFINKSLNNKTKILWVFYTNPKECKFTKVGKLELLLHNKTLSIKTRKTK